MEEKPLESDAAHEIRNSLALLSIRAQVARRKLEEDPPTREQMLELIAAIDKTVLKITDLL